MTHPREALSAYLDGELREEERRAVEVHLAACSSCAREMEDLAALDALARKAAAPVAPDGYFDALPSRVRARLRGPRRGISPLWLVPLAAGVMVAALAPTMLRENAARDRAARSERPAGAPARDSAAAPASAPAAGPPAYAEPAEELAVRQRAAPPAPREQKRESASTLAKEAPPAAPSKTVEARQETGTRADARPAPFAAAPPPAPAAEDEADRQARTAGLGDSAGASIPEGMADAATPATAQPTAAAPAQNRAGVAAGRLSAAGDEAGTAARARKASADDAFLAAAAIPLDTAAGARRAVDAWRRYVAAHPARDEARVLLVEAAVAAYRASGDGADRTVATREVEAYLARGDSPGAERVRAARRALDAPR